jgi:fructokinase
MSIKLGVDLGGTKTEIIALDENGKTLLRRRVSTPPHNYQATLAMIKDLVMQADTELGARYPIGFGTPGSPSPIDGTMRNCNSTYLNGRPLQRDLQEMLHRPIAIANDANCLALSEATDGAGTGAHTVFAVILGTGVGAGIVVRGEVLQGANGIAGEWSHNPLPWPRNDELPGTPCYCGQRGCIETFLSGPGMKRDHFEICREEIEPQQIAARAAERDSDCETTMNRYEYRLARALAHVINILDPNVIVLGGGISNLTRLYDNIPRLWDQYIFSDRVSTKLLRNQHGDSSGVRGAAWLAGTAVS